MAAAGAAPGIGGLGGFVAASDFAACLLPLLEALHWRGDPRHVAEALPHFATTLDLTGFRNTMAMLGWSSRALRLSPAALDPRLMPCLFVPDDGPIMVLLGRNGATLETFDGDLGRARPSRCGDLPGMVYVFSPIDGAEAGPRSITAWFTTTLARFRPLFWQAFGLTLALNLVGLAVPLFVMALYDKVIATGSLDLLVRLAAGVGLALLCDLVLRALRARVLAFIGARLDGIVGNALFEQLLALPPTYTERAAVGAQVSRIKDFETIREFCTGSMLLLLFELPFTLLFLAVLGLLGGVLVLAPLLAVLALTALGAIALPLVKTSVAASAKANSRRQEFVVEAVAKLRAIKLAGAEAVWQARFRELSAKAAFAWMRTSRLSETVQSLSSIMATATGVATLVLGVERVLAEALTVGGLVASMILVWRVLGPVQMAFMSFARLSQVRSSIQQIDALMRLRPERDSVAVTARLASLEGRVSLIRASLRYTPESDPALVGVSFDARAGELLAITGRNGSGKSSIIKVTAGLYPMQGGTVRIDDVDIRQLDPTELRHAVAYVPQVCHFFYGTIAQNLRLAQPLASDAAIQEACEEIGAWREIQDLPEGLETRIGDARMERLPASLMQKISLARAFLKDSRVMLLDEPVTGLDFEGDRAFMAALERRRGRATIFLVTHRPSHLRMADRVLVLEGGALKLMGPPDEVLRRLPEGTL